jgi:ABC-2 type transport system permease protein
MRAMWTLIVLDMKRFWQDRIRLVSSLLQPLLYLFVLGSGLGASSQMGGDNYRRFIFPGVLALTLLFSSTFAAITIVFDRQIGFLKAVLVAPVPRWAIAAGRIGAGALQALIQAGLLLVFAPFVGVHLDFTNVAEVVAAMALAATTFSAIGVAVAARFSSPAVFPIVSNALILPMFFLSGAMYPLAMAPRWMKVAAHFDPVAYAVDLLRRPLIGQGFFSVPLAIGALGLLTAVLLWSSVRVFARGEDTDDSRRGMHAMTAFARNR